jgi:hypothetical protein
MKRMLICFSCLALSLYGLVDQQNRLTKKQLAIPRLAREIKTIDEENARLRYAIEQFESPEHLLALYRKGGFLQLHFPKESGVMYEHQGLALTPINPQEENIPTHLVPSRTFVATLPH